MTGSTPPDAPDAPAAPGATGASAEQEHFTQEFWDARYGTAGRLWSGRPNRRLVAAVQDLPAGRAVDVGCGEGADAVWLATQGWQVLAVDVSAVALERARTHAEQAGPEVAGRITWARVDVFTWQPEPGSADLVTAHFMHLPLRPRARLLGAMARAVAPGGHLLVVGHHPDDPHPRPAHLVPLLFTAEHLVADLAGPHGADLTGWRVTTAAPARHDTGADGAVVASLDAVLHAVRPPGPGR